MKRRTTERSVTTEDVSLSRIVRRRGKRTPSPDVDPRGARDSSATSTGAGTGTSRREVRSTLYHDKYNSGKYSSSSRSSRGGGGRGGSSDGGGGGALKSNTAATDNRKSRSSSHHHYPSTQHQDNTSVSHHRQVHNSPPRYEYSLRGTNMDFRLSDLDVKSALYREFSKYGCVTIKVLGTGKDRHAFINFGHEDEARRAKRSMHDQNFYGRQLHLEWSKSTLSKFESHGGSGRNTSSEEGGGRGRGGGDTSRRTALESDRFVDYIAHHHGNHHRDRNSGTVGGASDRGDRRHDHHHYSGGTATGSSTRDISYKNSLDYSPLSHVHSGSHSQVLTTNKSSSSSTSIDPNATRTLFVGNLESDITERELRDLFGPYGRIESVDIKLHRSSGTAYAFVKFLIINDAIQAKNDMHGRLYGELRLKIGFGKGNPSVKVWIGNITTLSDLSEVRRELDRFGLIRRVDYVKGDNHAFVHFDSFDAAQSAVSSLSNYKLRSSGRPLKIDLSRYTQFKEFDDRDISPDLRPRSPLPTHGSSGGGGGGGGEHRSSHNEDSGYRRQVLDRGDAHYRHHDNGGMNGRNASPPPSHHHHPHHHHQQQQHPHHNTAPQQQPPPPPPPPPPSHHRKGRLVSDASHHSSSRNSSLERQHHRTTKRSRAESPSVDQHHHHHHHRRHGDERVMMSSSSYRHGGSSEVDSHRSKRPRMDFGGSGGGGGGHRPYNHHHQQHEEGGGGGGGPRNQRRRTSSTTGDDKMEKASNNSPSASRGGAGAKGGGSSSSKDLNDPASANTENAPGDFTSNDTALKLCDSTEPVSPDSDNSKPVNPDSTNAELSLSELAKSFPIAWHGSLVLKNTGFPTRMHIVGGDPGVAELLLRNKDRGGDGGNKDVGEQSSLKITQRLRLEPPRLEEVNKRMSSAGPSGHCILLALPGTILAPLQPSSATTEGEGGGSQQQLQLRPLRSLVSYLKQKEAAGIVALTSADIAGDNLGMPPSDSSKDVVGVLHAFPPCKFSQSQLLKIAPNVGSEPSKEDHIVVLLVKGTV